MRKYTEEFIWFAFAEITLLFITIIMFICAIINTV